MNISNIIGNFKRKADKRQQVQTSMKADKLKDLREQRIKLEGRNKIADLESQERAKISMEKSKLRKQGKVYKTVKKFKDYKSELDKKKKSFKPKPSVFASEGRNVFE